MMQRIPIHLQETAGLERRSEPICLGVPVSRGALPDLRHCVVRDKSDVVPYQLTATSYWADGSVKWLLVDASVSLPAGATDTIWLEGVAAPAEKPPRAPMPVRQDGNRLRAETGAMWIELRRDEVEDLIVCGHAVRVRLTTLKGAHTASFDGWDVEQHGPLKTVILVRGAFPDSKSPLNIRMRLTIHAEHPRLDLEVIVHNPRRARHRGGLWDLGDPGSVRFQDLSMEIGSDRAARYIEWYEAPEVDVKRTSRVWSLYQDSSGGDHWNSPNHVDDRRELTVRFRGYRVTGSEVDGAGDRAQPACAIKWDEETTVAGSILGFWQNFPKALRASDAGLSLGLFPRECSTLFELQGGEQKRHHVVLCFERGGLHKIRQWQQPVHAWVDPEAVEASQALPYFVPEHKDPNADFVAYVRQMLDPETGFLARREIIDEYGWRNFGDLYADHEAVNHQGTEPFVSHYNNQYDFLLVAATHYLRSADARWFTLLQDAARHTIDIDIYHTHEDRTAYSGGMFWHTDHYVPAGTATHRTYSRVNGQRRYGGGPSNEHNYTSGLLLYHLLTGDPEAKQAVLELADWVVAMDDGGRTIYALLSRDPTGLASKTVTPDYHGPGRGAGNSVRACLDAFTLSRDRRYLTKAEELIARCSHPDEDPGALGLDQPEFRWSYLVYLQSLDHYLRLKEEWSEFDYSYHYAVEVMRRYGAWIMSNEVPYKDVLDRVEIPTETWPAQDMRKAYVLNATCRYVSAKLARAYQQRARLFFERSLSDTCSFSTASLTRPLVIIAGNGSSQAYFDLHEVSSWTCCKRKYEFGTPRSFLRQSDGLIERVREGLSVGVDELVRAVREQLPSVRR